MKFKELLNQSADQLKKQLSAVRDEVEQLTVKTKLDQVKNRHELNAKRRDVARILTALKQK